MRSKLVIGLALVSLHADRPVGGRPRDSTLRNRRKMRRSARRLRG